MNDYFFSIITILKSIYKNFVQFFFILENKFISCKFAISLILQYFKYFLIQETYRIINMKVIKYSYSISIISFKSLTAAIGIRFFVIIKLKSFFFSH